MIYDPAVAAELYDPNSYDLMPSARRLSAEAQGKGGVGKLAILVPVAPPRVSTVLASLTAAGID